MSGFVTAIRSGTVRLEDGRSEDVIAGQTSWDSSCPELRDATVRALFGLGDVGRRGGARSGLERELEMRRRIIEGAGPRPGLSRWVSDGRDVAEPRTGKTRGTPKLLKGPPRLTVALSRSVMDTIRDEFLHTTSGHNLETGGWLFAEATRGWHTTIHVQIARPPGSGTKHGKHTFQPVADYQLEEDGFARSGAGHLVRIGDWHSHTGRGTDPSPADLDAWQSCFLAAEEKRGVAFYVGLVAATDDSRGFNRMRLDAYCLSRDKFDRVVCEPTTVKET
jgi:hypothetical protein